MRRTVPILAGLIVICGSVTSADPKQDDWRAFRGNDGSATSSTRGVPVEWGPDKNIVWKTDLPGAGTSTPIIVGDRVFVTCYSGYNEPAKPAGRQEDLKLHLVCLDRSSGKITWTQSVEPKLPEQASIRDSHGYASSTPTADDQRVYAFFGKSGVVAFDHSGKQLWRTDVGSRLNGWGSASSPVLIEGLLIINASVESDQLVALDPATGKEVWTLSGFKESWNTPIAVRHDGKTQIVAAIFGKVLGIDPKAGKIVWSSATDIPWYMVPSLVSHGDVVYALGGRPGGGLAVRLGGTGDVTASHRLWTSKKGNNVSSPVYHEGHLYWMHDNTETAYCANAKTGEVVYEERIPRAGQVYGSAVLADGRIYYPARGGAVHVVAAKPKFELLATNSWGDRRGNYLSSPAIAGKNLFIRTDRFVCCIGTR